MSSPVSPIYRCIDHALPFRVILEEHYRRHPEKLYRAVHHKVPGAREVKLEDETELLRLLKAQITLSEDRSAELKQLKDDLSSMGPAPNQSSADFRLAQAAKQGEVLAQEQSCAVADQPLRNVLHALDASAVCLSGGGIRSASFALGVLEGLARFGEGKLCEGARAAGEGRKSLLRDLDYLSTVSGGGYIGSWLMGWATRAGYQHVVGQLANPAPTSADPEPQPVRHLREYTSYLAPQYGLTVDSLTLFAILFRNMFLNWLILVPAIVALVCLPEFLRYWSYRFPSFFDADDPYFWLTFGGACIAITIAALVTALHMGFPKNARQPVVQANKPPSQKPALPPSMVLFLVPLLVACWLIGEMWVLRQGERVTGLALPTELSQHPFLWLWLLSCIPPIVVSTYRGIKAFPRRGGARTLFTRHGSDPNASGWQRLEWLRFLWSFAAPVVVGAIAAALLWGAGLGLARALPNAILGPPTQSVEEPDGQSRTSVSRPHSPAVGSATALRHNAAPLAMVSAGVDIQTDPTRDQGGLWQRFLELLSAPTAPEDPARASVQRVFTLFVVPVVLMILMLSTSMLSGLLSNIESEEEREWWSRSGGLLLAVMMGWSTLSVLSFFAPEVLKGAWAAGVAAVGIGAGSLGSLAGLSAATSSGLKKVKKEQLTGVQKFLANHNLIVPAISFIALVCLSLLLAGFSRWLRDTAYSGHDAHPLLLGHPTLLVFVTAATLALLANQFIVVNTFSLHGMYRMRLTRAYLGASNFARRPNPFTNFDSDDNLYEADVPHGGDAPLHVVNTALNLVATDNLAWQQRKAEPFSFTPLFCGSWRLGYVPTELYGGSRGVRLGTAMAISGAAFNPNMGYNSSPMVTLLMTFFNARLGWWLPNPIWPILNGDLSVVKDGQMAQPSLTRRVILAYQNLKTKLSRDARRESADWLVRRFLRRNGPTWALVNEALGRTNDTSKWIQLSDGGHFENLALYEMVLRRCRRIILVDSGADCDYEFEDLGNAVRKIYIDLGVRITFPDFPDGLPMKRDGGKANRYCVLGEIDYSCVDGGGEKGQLVYIKPVLKGGEPEDIRAYAATHKVFPHESTVNQFFNEAQFESYRNLGSFVIREIVDNARAEAPPRTIGVTMEDFIGLLRAPEENMSPFE